jgi:hypothetical protein
MEFSDRDRPLPPADSSGHLDAAEIALIAIGEQAASSQQAEHTGRCPACRTELESLMATAQIARSTLDDMFVTPHPRVWEEIRRELAHSRTGELESAPAQHEPPGEQGVSSGAGTRRRILWGVGALAAAASIVAALVLGESLRPLGAGAPVARASLESLPAWPTATGTAVVTAAATGSRVVTIELDAPSVAGAVREVWLLTPDVDELLSLGLLDGSGGVFVIPEEVDLSRFSVVDVSLEPLDGDPGHSGDSIVRGALDQS